jgi:hypothetical protein
VDTPTEVNEQMQAFVEPGVECFPLECRGSPGLTTVEMTGE